MASVRCGCISTPGRNPACAENKNPTAGSRRWGENHFELFAINPSASQESKKKLQMLTESRYLISFPFINNFLDVEL